MATSSPSSGAALQGSQKWVSVVVHDRYAVLSMCKEPVNSMDLVMWTQLEEALDALEADKNVQVGVVWCGRDSTGLTCAFSTLCCRKRTRIQTPA
jgi:hypothetical protein